MKEFINENKFLKWVAWFVGVLIIGGVGNGFWEIILKPFFVYSGNATMNYLTSIFSSFNNDIYESISIRNTNSVNIKTFSLLVILFGLISIFIINMVQDYLVIRAKNKDLDSQEINKISRNAKKLKSFNIFMSCFFIPILFIVSSFSLLKSTYVYKKIAYFEYLLKINGDVMDDKEIKRVESKFAQIKNSEDYNIITQDLRDTAIKHNKSLKENPL